MNYLEVIANRSVPFAHPGGRGATLWMAEQAGVTASSLVLEAGCGTGHSGALLAKEMKAKVIGVDRDVNFIQAAKKAHPQHQYVTADLCQLPFNDASFDFIFCESVLSFVQPIDRVLAEMRRVLKEEGSIWCNEMTMLHPLQHQEQRTLTSFYGFSKMWTEEDWQDVCQHARLSFEKKKSGTIIDGLLMANPQDFIVEEEPFTNEEVRVLDMHQQLTMKHSTALGFTIWKAQKNFNDRNVK
ncbi:class I SAM-dependent methyltransferase [Bacillaceae bacterium SIJ1]|uniref:class I SAM-dependent methyltransferase n=1 Tax=Litoribacterium kuwaitense TaxID=1398745 RepID=UPI0013EA4671|nr:class I SAM-dependent methyltransferase [Litoribacterium kuwaitense]NGP43753.1 class I SAM-dependent methyltransferase [Litoribacterium kuwaitense]